VCCESCIRYEKCLEEDKFKDDCCPRCPEYEECAGLSSNRQHDLSREDFSADEDDFN